MQLICILNWLVRLSEAAWFLAKNHVKLLQPVQKCVRLVSINVVTKHELYRVHSPPLKNEQENLITFEYS